MNEPTLTPTQKVEKRKAYMVQADYDFAHQLATKLEQCQLDLLNQEVLTQKAHEHGELIASHLRDHGSKPQTPPGVDELAEKWSAGTKSAYVTKSAITEATAALQVKLQEAERQRDEVHKNCIKQLDWEQLRAERDHLIKVVNKLEPALMKASWDCDCFEDEGHRESCAITIINKALKAYSLLPHVINKKGTQAE